MAEEKASPSQSIFISSSQVSGQFGQAGQNLTQAQQDIHRSTTQSLTHEGAIALLAELEDLLKAAGLPSSSQEKALRYLSAAKEEVSAEKPDKKFTADSLKKVTGVLKDANETIKAGQGIWDKVKPIFDHLAPWLGVAAGFFF